MTNNRGSGQSAFAFHLTDEKLRECRDMTAEEKLRWLEEANAFVRKFVPVDRLAQWERLASRQQQAATNDD